MADHSRLERIAHAADEFLFAYIGTILDRLLREFSLSSGAWHPAATDEVLANPASVEAARQFRDEQIARGAWLADAPEHSRAHAQSERVLDGFASAIEAAADDPELSRRLALADTTVEVILADEPDLSLTMLLDRTPIEVRHDGTGTPRSRCRSRASTSPTSSRGSSSSRWRSPAAASAPRAQFASSSGVVPILRSLQAGHDARRTTPTAVRRSGPPTADRASRTTTSGTRAVSAPASESCSTRPPTTFITPARSRWRNRTLAISGPSR